MGFDRTDDAGDTASAPDRLVRAVPSPGRSGEIPTDLIDSGENLVSIPTLRHWQLNSWYQKPDGNFLDPNGNPMTPRDYLKGQGYDERRRVGLMGLHAVGVLK